MQIRLNPSEIPVTFAPGAKLEPHAPHVGIEITDPEILRAILALIFPVSANPCREVANVVQVAQIEVRGGEVRLTEDEGPILVGPLGWTLILLGDLEWPRSAFHQGQWNPPPSLAPAGKIVARVDPGTLERAVAGEEAASLQIVRIAYPTEASP